MLLLAALAGCQTLPPPPVTLADFTWNERKSWLSAQRHFESRGRVSIVYEGGAEQGDFQIQHNDQEYQIRLSGPFGLGTVALDGDADGWQMTTARHGVTMIEDPARELTELLGYPVPVDALSYWALGVPQPGLPAIETLEQGTSRLAALEQGGWRITYREYRFYRGLELPRKVDLEGPGVRIRLVFRHWKIGL